MHITGPGRAQRVRTAQKHHRLLAIVRSAVTARHCYSLPLKLLGKMSKNEMMRSPLGISRLMRAAGLDISLSKSLIEQAFDLEVLELLEQDGNLRNELTEHGFKIGQAVKLNSYVKAFSVASSRYCIECAVTSPRATCSAL